MTDHTENLRLAFAAFAQGRLDEALDLTESVLQADPKSADALALAGQLQFALQSFEKARDYLDQALQIVPGQPALLNNLSAVYLALGQFDEAADLAGQSADRSPENFGAWLNLGLAMLAQRKHGDAIKAFEEVLSRQPEHLLAKQKLAQARYRGGRAHLGSRELFTQILKQSQGDRETRALLADSYIQNAEISAGLDTFRQALAGGDEIGQDRLSRLHSSYLIALQYDVDTTPVMLRDEHESWAKAFGSRERSKVHAHAGEKLRIGWVSPRFSSGPLASFFLPVLECFDREISEHFLYSGYPHDDPVNSRFREFTDHWREIDGMDPGEVAECMSGDGLDVLVDLSGHAPGGQLRAMSRKPAPVQVSWLDSFATTGLAEMDFFISDDYLSPTGNEQFFTEQLLRLEGGRLCYRPHLDFELPIVRPENNAIVFACFNRLAKLNDQVLAAWAAILKRVPDSRLELRNSMFDEPEAKTGFLQRCEGMGIDINRVSLHGSSDYSALMNAYQGVDIALDPFPFSGCTTSCDALWMGVPVITRSGDTMVSRQSAAILSQLNLDELISKNSGDYVSAACELADNRPWLDELRSSLRSRMQARFEPRSCANELLDRLLSLAAKNGI